MRRDENGLMMIAAALLVIGAVVFVVAEHEVELHREQVRAQGIGLANSLARIPLDRLAPANGQLGPLDLIFSARGSTLLAYAVVADPGGRVLAAESFDGRLPQETPAPLDPIAWTGEQRRELGPPTRWVREFAAPVLRDGVLAAQVRIGYFEPGFETALESSSFHARIALLIFLLIPLALLLFRRELRPLERAIQSVDPSADADRGARGFGLAPAEAIETFASRFRSMSEELDRKAAAMQRERVALLASSKVLAHQKNRGEVFLEALPDGVIAIDDGGKITAVNARAEALLRRTRDELIGAAPSSWSPAPEVLRLAGRHSGMTKRHLRAETVEYSPDALGQRRILASIQSIQSGTGAVVVLRDISAEFSARKHQAEFLAHMAHELKAPLNVMSLYTESLLGPEASQEGFRVDACNVIRDEVDRLNGLINNIFSIGRIESGAASLDRQRVRTRELLSDVFESASREGQAKGLKFALELPGKLEPIHADKQLISVAIKNLLTNAIKYNREGGNVGLSATEDEHGLSIRITDTGVGIREDEIDQLFEKFFRSEDESIRKVSGHGLGLSLVKEIVALHGGEVRVQSRYGEGSEFTLFFAANSALFREGD